MDASQTNVNINTLQTDLQTLRSQIELITKILHDMKQELKILSKEATNYDASEIYFEISETLHIK